ncbi:hypothetical protein B0H13DRAFT_1852025 [Mycena leptocephala]|nr:hypothetical protein B0H13DRAFT_1852025 [Mycena leptocephala]
MDAPLPLSVLVLDMPLFLAWHVSPVVPVFKAPKQACKWPRCQAHKLSLCQALQVISVKFFQVVSVKLFKSSLSNSSSSELVSSSSYSPKLSSDQISLEAFNYAVFRSTAWAGNSSIVMPAGPSDVDALEA